MSEAWQALRTAVISWQWRVDGLTNTLLSRARSGDILKFHLKFAPLDDMSYNMISRCIQKELRLCAKEYPSVTVLGPRQSGKTTLAQMTFPKLAYCSLEDPDVRRQANTDPRGMLEGFSGGVILDANAG